MGEAKTRPSSFSRLAVQVADDLRMQILTGDLADGEELPAEEELRERYPVSRPTLREAMRVLEAEGLLSVRRGAHGGAVVHKPTTDLVAYSLGLVLAAQGEQTADLWSAVTELESACAAGCATRPDRETTIVPTLTYLLDRADAVIHDLTELARLAAMMHDAVIDMCGNASLSVATTALKTLYVSHGSRIRPDGSPIGVIDVASRRRLLGMHRDLVAQIKAGDAAAARSASLAMMHFLWDSGAAGPDEKVIRGSVVRTQFTEGVNRRRR
ncbi:FadR/GntR family transcriptional regulator [Nocardioides nitrophenolicus]|uniref:FadR/GntR family transcriptional regulator n=1 Tax=Nocardioides nitrophenolicus TaxID=60489 RepID=UPI001959F2EF|nr:GntR family transcriptional regulator [Nocardioides nitrophenolicus]MBM7519333.1 DNA-binding FadR family transcriptional regulator [Nocardioides nitrophenolicus]